VQKNKIGEYLAKLLARTWLLVTLPDIHRFKKPFIIWLSTTQPHLKYIATLHWKLSIMACFADIDVSQGSVATYARCDGIFNIHLTANLPKKFQWKKYFNRLRFDSIMVMSLWPHLFGPSYRHILRHQCVVIALCSIGPRFISYRHLAKVLYFILLIFLLVYGSQPILHIDHNVHHV